MNTTTLRGVFPGPKPIHRKNFLKENVRELKRMQGIMKEMRVENSSVENKRYDRYKDVPSRVSSNFSGKTPSLRTHSFNTTTTTTINTKNDQKKTIKYTNRGVQTERFDETTIKPIPPAPSLNLRRKPLDHGDAALETLQTNLEKLQIQKKKPENSHQPGTLPRYLKERKAEMEETKKNETENPEMLIGHILLPDSERREYLRVSRESYADLIRELNSMPVRNDTLKMRKRKMQIEEELKKIEEAIKVFQKPKVFVKSDM